MIDIYRAIEPYLAALGLTALSASIILGAVYAALKSFGEKWVTSKLSERLEAFRHAQQREIEQLKFQINASMDRATKLHQREFETLPEAWSKLLTAYNTVRAFTSPLQSYAAVGRMSDGELDDFLAPTEFSDAEKSEVKTALVDRDQIYQKLLFRYRLGTAFRVCRESNDFLQKGAIFIPVLIKQKFDAISDMVWDGLTEHRIKEQLRDGRERPKYEKLEKDSGSLLQELESEIQKRLWNDVHIK